MEKSNFLDSLQAMIENLEERISDIYAEMGDITNPELKDRIRWTGGFSEITFLADEQFLLATAEEYDEEIELSLGILEERMRFVNEVKSDIYLTDDIEIEELKNKPEEIGEFLTESCKQFKRRIYSASPDDVWTWIMWVRKKELFCAQRLEQCGEGEDLDLEEAEIWSWLFKMCNYLIFQLSQAFEAKSPVFLEAWETKYEREKFEKKQGMH